MTGQAEHDAVDQAFRALRERVDAAAVAPAAQRIEARGRRRRTGQVALAGLTVLAVLAGGYAAAREPDRRTAPNLPAVSPSAPAEPTPTGVRPAVVPPGFLAAESHAEEVIDNHDYQTSCFGQPVTRRTMTEFVGGQQQRVLLTESLYVYADEAAAKAVVRDLRPKLRQCSGFDSADVLEPVSSPTLGDEAASVTVALPRDGAGEHTGEPFQFLVVRVGAAVAVFDGISTGGGPGSRAAAMIPRMCVFRPGCAPAHAPPLAPSAGGEAWAVVAGTHPTAARERPQDEKAGELGALGYRAAVVPLSCDVGAAAALGVSAADTSYTVVYFGSEQDADTVAVPLGLTVVRVRTYCL